MSARTPSSIQRESAGSQTKLIAAFSAINSGDTWTSGLTGIQDFTFITTGAVTNATALCNVSQASGVFTFKTSEEPMVGSVVVYGKF